MPPETPTLYKTKIGSPPPHPILDHNRRMIKKNAHKRLNLCSVSSGQKIYPLAPRQYPLPLPKRGRGGGRWAGWLTNNIYFMRSLDADCFNIFGCRLCVHVLLPGRCLGTGASVVAQRVGRNWSERMRRIQTVERALICKQDCISNLNLVNCWLFKDLETYERYQKKREGDIAVLSLVSLVTALVPLLF